MKFDKRLAIPEIYRNITSSDSTILIESPRAWINLSVRSDYYVEDQPEISIRNQTLITYNSDSIEIQLDFEMPRSLSNDLVSPELLLIELN